MNTASYKKSIYVCIYAYIFLSKEKDVEKYSVLVNVGYPKEYSGEGRDLRGEEYINFFFIHSWFV